MSSVSTANASDNVVKYRVIDGATFLQKCSAELCEQPAKLYCPTCAKFDLPPTPFCSQECFTKAWKLHNLTHKAKQSFVPPSFEYTGALRPNYVTPMRSVPDHIPKPDYALTGEPLSEQQSRMSAQIPIYTQQQIQGVRAACVIGREVLDMAARMIRPGVTTEEIDLAVHRAIIDRGAYPSPLNYYNFPKSCCTSVNEVICHGIPDCRKLENGDIVNVDISVYYKGHHADLNETYCVGEVQDQYKQLIKVTHDALALAIQDVKPGVMIRQLGKTITNHVTKFGYSVVRTYCGHGIGELFHCAPNIPHYSPNKAVGSLKPGMIFTIEPMINMGKYKDETWTDDWTSVTVDGQRSAQFEHTLLVTQTGVEILTARTPQSPAFWWENQSSEKKTNNKNTEEKQNNTIINNNNNNDNDVSNTNNVSTSDGANTATAAAKKKKKKNKKKKKKTNNNENNTNQDEKNDNDDGDDNDDDDDDEEEK